MSERTTSRWISFKHPALIDGVDQSLPAGDYLIETDEEQIPGLSFVAYRRVKTMIVVPALVGTTTGRQLVEVEVAALQAALDRDSAASGR